MMLSGYYGPQFWYEPIVKVFDFPQVFGDLTFMDLWLPMLLTSLFVAHMPACIYNVAKARRSQGLPVAPVFLDWIPMIVYTGACCAWLGSPYTTLLKEERLVLFCLTMSLVFGRMTTKIILAHLTRQPFPMWTIMLAPLIGGAVLANLPLLGLPAITAANELAYLRSYFVFALIVYSRWAMLVVSSICNYLEINCLTITPPKTVSGQADAPPATERNGKLRSKAE
jgi:ethanolaminephosphotransferase